LTPISFWSLGSSSGLIQFFFAFMEPSLLAVGYSIQRTDLCRDLNPGMYGLADLGLAVMLSRDEDANVNP
jgi:hypothetical protein